MENESLSMVENNSDFEDKYGIVLYKENWHAGVIGIVASRIKETYNKPTIIIGVDDSIGKGSCRSIPQLDMVQALDYCSSMLDGYGGHPMAAGLTIDEKNLEKFSILFDEYCKLNEIDNTSDFIVKCAKDGLTLDKYGVAPFLPKSQIQEVPVEKEIIKEVIKEIPVEKEIIVEKIVTKEVKDTHLIEELEKIKSELLESKTIINEQKNKIKEQDDVLEHFKNVTVNRRTKHMRSSNLNDTYYD